MCLVIHSWHRDFRLLTRICTVVTCQPRMFRYLHTVTSEGVLLMTLCDLALEIYSCSDNCIPQLKNIENYTFSTCSGHQFSLLMSLLKIIAILTPQILEHIHDFVKLYSIESEAASCCFFRFNFLNRIFPSQRLLSCFHNIITLEVCLSLSDWFRPPPVISFPCWQALGFPSRGTRLFISAFSLGDALCF